MGGGMVVMVVKVVVVRAPACGIALLRFREMACMRPGEAWSRESPRSLSGDHHFERCCILRTVQPTQPTARRRKLTPPQPPTFRSHWSGPSSSMGYHTTHGPEPFSGLCRTSVNLETIEYYLVRFRETENCIVFTATLYLYILNNNLRFKES